MKTNEGQPVAQQTIAAEVEELGILTPFSEKDFSGGLFARGNMLGGASPLESAVPAPWTN